MVFSIVVKLDGADCHIPSTIGEVDVRVVPFLSKLLVIAVPRDIDHGVSIWRNTLESDGAIDIGS